MEDEEDEKEIQIGFPTDVKHLAHIGAENAKASQPSWVINVNSFSPSRFSIYVINFNCFLFLNVKLYILFSWPSSKNHQKLHLEQS